MIQQIVAIFQFVSLILGVAKCNLCKPIVYILLCRFWYMSLVLTSQLGTACIFPCGFFMTSGLTGRAIKDMLIVGITTHENHKTCPVVKRPGNIRKVPITWSKLIATEQHSQNCTENIWIMYVKGYSKAGRKKIIWSIFSTYQNSKVFPQNALIPLLIYE